MVRGHLICCGWLQSLATDSFQDPMDYTVQGCGEQGRFSGEQCSSLARCTGRLIVVLVVELGFLLVVGAGQSSGCGCTSVSLRWLVAELGLLWLCG